MNQMPPFPKGEPAFVELLKKHEKFIPHWDLSLGCQQDELDVSRGIKVVFHFPDQEKLLDSALHDLSCFLSDAGIPFGDIPVTISATTGLERESYRLTVQDEILLESGDTEGIRRGIYYLRDQIAASPYLKKGKKERKCWLENRISRCFFGPIKRAPYFIDELLNDIDYYPEEYLSRLAHEGINGLWLTIEFREICNTSIRKAPPEAARRIAKLRKIVEKCRRYGIKIWAFCIEPYFWSNAVRNPVPEGFDELLGTHYSAEDYVIEMNSFCPNSETAQKFLYESTSFLFRSVPHLGGLITISHGERLTSCLSGIDVFGNGYPTCSECKLSIGEIAQKVLEPMKQGIKDANPNAGFISWLYMAAMAQHSDWIYQIPSRLSKDIILAFNFESGITAEQVDRVPVGGDYWLSRVGPSDRFGRMAEATRGHCSLAAKLQVACSHECASVPYIPVPGLLYRKYKAMKRFGVRHVIQCWFFGNYPGLMNRASGELAYEDFEESEDEFLETLAKSEWGKDYKQTVRAWKAFAEGYTFYPLDNRFQYYGPMHDGSVWPLYLKPVRSSLTRSWRPDNFPSGDALGECMVNFEIGELADLTEKMTQKWHEGVEMLRKIEPAGHELDFSLVEALDIQFRSGYNILKFYGIRQLLYSGASSASSLLNTLEAILLEEKKNSLRLAELCRKDSRLGYHSESESYKYFPEKLQWRAECIQEVLDHDLPELKDAISQHKNLRQVCCQEWDTPALPGSKYGANGIHWSFEIQEDNLLFHLNFEGGQECNEMVQLFFSDADCLRKPCRKIELHKRDWAKTENGWHADVPIPCSFLNFAVEFRFGVERICTHPNGEMTYSNDTIGDFRHDIRLIYGYFMLEKTRLVKI